MSTKCSIVLIETRVVILNLDFKLNIMLNTERCTQIIEIGCITSKREEEDIILKSQPFLKKVANKRKNGKK